MICIDFTDLNDACPKYCFSLPMINIIIDATTGHELLSFMDAFSGYNQIKMDEVDIPNISFITDQKLYCYIMMSFKLKNADATYKILVMEVYLDDMLVKSVKKDNHVEDLDVLDKFIIKHPLIHSVIFCSAI